MLRSLDLTLPPARLADRFPFSVPAIRSLPRIDFSSAVTFFVGENGSGKSTLLEAIALATRLPTVGSEHAALDRTLAAQRELAKVLKLTWERRHHRGFFLRAEDFFGFTKQVAAQRAAFQERLAEIDVEYEGRSRHAKGLAAGPMHTSLHEMEQRYGVDLDANSHGQSFLKLFQARLVPEGLYLLDEPEAPLSPQSQLGLIAMLKQMVSEKSQFIIATHSPMLLAFPNATIYSFDEIPVRAVPFADLEHVNLTRDFLADPGRFLRQL